jgi:RNA polymerase sigma-70 factor (ECF subfamily)
MEAVAVRAETVDLAGFLDGHLTAAYRLARAIVADDADAEDLVQEASLIAWRKHRSLRDPGRLEAWFDRIVINLCRDRLRRRHTARTVERSTWPVDDHVAVPGEDTRDDLDLDAALDALDVEHRIVVLLRYWQDRTVDDIAARLDIPPGTVKSRLHYALRQLRERLEASDGRA